MKILHVLNSNRFSGAENVVCQIVEMFRSDTDVEMVYCSPDGQIRDALAERDVVFAPISEMSAKEIKRVIGEQQPDVIHAHDMRAGFVSALACGKTPLISHIHNNAFDSRGISVKSVAYLLAGMKARHIFWVSKSAFEGYCFSKLFEKKSSILYNIIDVDKLYKRMELDANEYGHDVIFLGRLTTPKNPERLMRVCAKAVERKSDIKIAVVGTGELEKETQDLCAELGLQNNVQFWGFQGNPLKMLHDAKVMIMTSRWEGTPMCALEAMALGVPIVSTPVDGLKDLVRDGENGFLSENDDELAQKIIDIAEQVALRELLSNGAKMKSAEINDVPAYKQALVVEYR